MYRKEIPPDCQETEDQDSGDGGFGVGFLFGTLTGVMIMLAIPLCIRTWRMLM